MDVPQSMAGGLNKLLEELLFSLKEIRSPYIIDMPKFCLLDLQIGGWIACRET